MIQIDDHIFQMGWNHHLARYIYLLKINFQVDASFRWKLSPAPLKMTASWNRDIHWPGIFNAIHFEEDQTSSKCTYGKHEGYPLMPLTYKKNWLMLYNEPCHRTHGSRNIYAFTNFPPKSTTTPRKFNIVPENRPSQEEKESSLPTMIFQKRLKYK